MTQEERTKRINVLVAKLREERATYKAQKKELREYYKRTIRELKSEIRQLMKQQKEEKTKKKGSFINSILLNYYESCTKKGQELRYKLDKPEDYEADKLVRDIDRHLSRLEKNREKGPLSEKDISFLMDTHQALKIMEEKKLGKFDIERRQAISRIEELMPDPEAFKKLQGALNQFEDLLKSVQPEPAQ